MKRFGLMLSTLILMGTVAMGPGALLSNSFLSPGIAEANAPAKAEGEEEGHAAKKDDGAIPYKAMVAAGTMAACAFATAITQMKIGTAAMGTMVEKPEVAPMCIVLLAIPETIVILGFVVGAMILMF